MRNKVPHSLVETSRTTECINYVFIRCTCSGGCGHTSFYTSGKSHSYYAVQLSDSYFCYAYKCSNGCNYYSPHPHEKPSCVSPYCNNQILLQGGTITCTYIRAGFAQEHFFMCKPQLTAHIFAVDTRIALISHPLSGYSSWVMIMHTM